MLRTAGAALLTAALLLPALACTDPQGLDGLVIMLPPSTPDNVNVNPIILQRPSAARLNFKWVWERDGEQYAEFGPSKELFPLWNFETFPGEEWTLTVTPVSALVEGPASTASTVIADAGRDSDNDRDGWTENSGDCDDTDALLFPFADNDNDGFEGCVNPFGFDDRPVDCDDFDRFTHPDVFVDDAARLGDNDCDGMIDEDAHGPGSLAVVEVLSDPSDGTDAGWIEIVNLSGDPIELGGWTIQGFDAVGVVPTARLEPGERGLLCTDPEAVALDCLNTDELDFPLDDAYLRLLASDIIAHVQLGELPAAAGASTQLSADVVMGSAAMDDPLSWCVATVAWDGVDLGSPGASNEVCPAGS